MTRSSRPQLLAALLVVCGAHGASRAASFDCHAATLSGVEKRVCARPVLSALDEQMALAFRQLRAQDTAAVAGQRRWLAADRDRCADDDCLFAAYSARLGALRTRTGSCPVSEQALVGRWASDGRGSDAFDAVAFTRDGGQRAFESWLHQAPFASGSWTLKDCAISVSAGASGQLEIALTVLTLDGGVLRLASDLDARPLELRRTAGR